MDYGLHNKVAFVSGGSRGIGRAIAKALLDEGASVMLAARTKTQLEATAEELYELAPGRVDAVAADLTDPAEVQRAVAAARDRFGPIEISISNILGHVVDSGHEDDAAISGKFASMPSSEFRGEFQYLLVSAWALARECLPDMRAAKWGRICNIGSGVAREPAHELPHVLPNTIRPAVAGMHRMMAADLAGTGITVNNVLTGSILTERNLTYWRWLASERGETVVEVTRDFHDRIPLRRQGKPSEMAALVAFLCSEQASQITGQSIPVDGGISRHL